MATDSLLLTHPSKVAQSQARSGLRAPVSGNGSVYPKLRSDGGACAIVFARRGRRWLNCPQDHVHVGLGIGYMQPMRDVSLEIQLFSWQTAWSCIYLYSRRKWIARTITSQFRVAGKVRFDDLQVGKVSASNGLLSAAVRMFLLFSCLLHTTLNNRLISQRPPSIYHREMLLSCPPPMDLASAVDLS